ncbi:MAG: hypothetical protein V1928_05500 [Parcubacteria group bacterium]
MERLYNLQNVKTEIRFSDHLLMRFIERWPGPPPTDKKGFLEKLVKSVVFHKEREGRRGDVYITPDLNWEFYLNIEMSDIDTDCYVVGVISCYRHTNPYTKKKARYRDQRAREKREDEDFKKFTLREK